MKTSLLVIISIILFPTNAAGQIIQSSMNWETGVFSLSIEDELTEQPYNRPASFYRTEKNIQNTARQIIFDRLLDLQIDSYNTLGDLARRDLGLLETVDQIITALSMKTVIPDLIRETVFSRFELAVYPTLTTKLVRHNNPFPMENVLHWQPGSEYSGLVIYAKRQLPVHGEEIMARLKPALFPVIYDTNLRLIVDRNRMAPEYARRWGGASYSTGFDEDESRVGSNPLRILATGAFGITPTDIIIPAADADILLYNPTNRQILQEGRILIIISDDID